LIVIVAFATTAPFGSVTVPSIALENCAFAAEHINISVIIKIPDLVIAFNRFFLIKVLLPLSMAGCSKKWIPSEFNHKSYAFGLDMNVQRK